MDEFDQAWCVGDTDDGSVVALGFLAAQGDAFEAFESTKALFDVAFRFVEGFGKDFEMVLFVGFVGDVWENPTGASCVTVGLAGIAFATDCSAGLYVGSDVELYQKVGAIMDFATF